MLQYIEKYKPKYIGFEAFEMNRQSLYKKISDRLNKELIEIKYKEFDKNPITNEKLKPNQFFFERIDDENKEIK